MSSAPAITDAQLKAMEDRIVARLSELLTASKPPAEVEVLYLNYREAGELMYKTPAAMKQWCYVNRKKPDLRMGKIPLWKKSTVLEWLGKGSPSRPK